MLKIDNLGVKYGAVSGVKKIDLLVNQGELVALLGANGAGKSTTLLAVAGALKCDQGSIVFNGQDITLYPPEKTIRMGIAMVPETRDVFPDLTTHENLKLGAFIRSRDKVGIEQDLEKMYGLFPILKDRVNQSAGTLSGGEQQQLVIARALMSRPKLLLLDEPSLGLAPAIVDHIFELILHLKNQGLTILLVEQNAVKALQLADRAYVLSLGTVATAGPAKDIASNSDLASIYFGN
ncbi:ABC transporter ATP-binding protein [Desulfobacula sp.]|uniref:ABC transporter ATP-binding protein n=1 Tax=Desulfobacula sp. TaxID=2593537 RepID=UPI00260D3A6A|nr:ABC transporter ATP-binding protein [Desulfobacula sp.]